LEKRNGMIGTYLKDLGPRQASMSMISQDLSSEPVLLDFGYSESMCAQWSFNKLKIIYHSSVGNASRFAQIPLI
jgi:hypothetical protein